MWAWTKWIDSARRMVLTLLCPFCHRTIHVNTFVTTSSNRLHLLHSILRNIFGLFPSWFVRSSIYFAITSPSTDFYFIFLFCHSHSVHFKEEFLYFEAHEFDDASCEMPHACLFCVTHSGSKFEIKFYPLFILKRRTVNPAPRPSVNSYSNIISMAERSRCKTQILIVTFLDINFIYYFLMWAQCSLNEQLILIFNKIGNDSNKLIKAFIHPTLLTQ